ILLDENAFLSASIRVQPFRRTGGPGSRHPKHGPSPRPTGGAIGRGKKAMIPKKALTPANPVSPNTWLPWSTRSPFLLLSNTPSANQTTTFCSSPGFDPKSSLANAPHVNAGAQAARLTSRTQAPWRHPPKLDVFRTKLL